MAGKGGKYRIRVHNVVMSTQCVPQAGGNPLQGRVGSCGKVGKPLQWEICRVWKTLWKMFITYCTRKLLWNLCELIEQRVDREGHRSRLFCCVKIASFVEFCRSVPPARRRPPATGAVCPVYLSSHCAKRPAKNTSGYRTNVLKRFLTNPAPGQYNRRGIPDIQGDT